MLMIAKNIQYKHLIIMLCIAIIMTGCNQRQKISIPGYVEGKYIYISTNYSGTLKSIYVSTGKNVNEGQPLFSLEDLPQSADLQAATARVQEATDQVRKIESKFKLVTADFHRKQYLYKKDVISKEEFDNITSNYSQTQSELKSAEANLTAKQADLHRATWEVQQKIINAPVSSLVFDIYYSQGEIVPANTAVLSLLAPSQLKIIFFIPENLLSIIKLNQLIDVTCDNCRIPIKGKVTYISPNVEYTPPVIYSTDEREKLVYRVEALPQLSNVLFDLHPGQPVSVNLEI